MSQQESKSGGNAALYLIAAGLLGVFVIIPCGLVVVGAVAFFFFRFEAVPVPAAPVPVVVPAPVQELQSEPGPLAPALVPGPPLPQADQIPTSAR